MKTVAVCICTRQRPKMLARCLESVCAQHIPEGVDGFIMVVENDSTPVNRDAVIAAEALYFHEPKIGISAARNRAVREALALGADHIAFIDDDEVADPWWLHGLMHPRFNDTDIVAGRTVLVYPDKPPFWTVKTQHQYANEGEKMKCCATNNIRIAARLFMDGMHFNESIGNGGDGDTEFTRDAVKRGYDLRVTHAALTYETVHLSRITFTGQLKREFSHSYANTKIDMRLGAKRGKTALILLKGVLAIPRLILSAAFLSKRGVFKSCVRMVAAAGRLSAIMGVPYKGYYKNVVGE